MIGRLNSAICYSGDGRHARQFVKEIYSPELTSRTTPLLRFGTYRLPAIEHAVIQTIILLSASDKDFAWKLVDEPPYDAILIDRDAVDEVIGMASVILRLTRRSLGKGPNALERPLRAAKLQQLLKRIQPELLERRSTLLALGTEAATKIEVSGSARLGFATGPSRSCW